MTNAAPSLLLVEDERGVRLTLTDRLSAEGYRVESAADGEAGLQVASAVVFDVIVLDVMLPRLSGLDVCRALRQRGVETPVLMLTAKAQVTDKVVGLELGADDYLTKPFESIELLARLEVLLRRRPSGAAARPVSTGVQAADALHRAPRRYALARCTACRRLGVRRDPAHAHGGCARGGSAAEDRAEPEGAHLHRDDARARVPARRLRQASGFGLRTEPRTFRCAVSGGPEGRHLRTDSREPRARSPRSVAFSASRKDPPAAPAACWRACQVPWRRRARWRRSRCRSGSTRSRDGRARRMARTASRRP